LYDLSKVDNPQLIKYLTTKNLLEGLIYKLWGNVKGRFSAGEDFDETRDSLRFPQNNYLVKYSNSNIR